MPSSLRPWIVLAIGCLALAATGCGSNNKGKIEGRWKIVSAPNLDAAAVKQMEGLGIYAYFDFGADGTLTVGVTSPDPQAQKKIEASGVVKTIRCKYRLLSGDRIECYDLPQEMQKGGGGLFGNKTRAQSRAKITGDDMTMIDDDGTTFTFKRVK